MAGRTRLVGTLAACLAALLVAAPAASAARPNVVVVVTDDQTLESFNPTVMPRAVRGLAERGTRFAQGIVSTPQCCPSRAGYLTGQYPQNTGVRANRPGYQQLREKRDVLPSWLRAAGYRTIHVGKYLNGYTALRGARPAPGWDRWRTLMRADYRQPNWSIDGRFRSDADRYLTSTMNRITERLIERFGSRRRPFYLQVDHLAPHIGSREETGRCAGAAIPARRDGDLFAATTAPRNPATDEADLGDKPEFIGRNGAPGPAVVARADRHYGCALGSLRSVDRGIGVVLSALRREQQLANTLIVFTSDNGYSFLEHRMPLSKGLPYEEHLRVPFVIRPPAGFPRASRSGEVSAAPVANIDLAPTILQLARAEPCRAGGRTCRRMDGRSLVPLLRGRAPRWVEDRAILTAFSVNADAYKRSCRWDGLRTPERVLVHHLILPEPGGLECRPADEYEYYDLAADPNQLQGDGPVPLRLAARLDRLRRCSGIRGRDPRRAKTPFCE